MPRRIRLSRKPGWKMAEVSEGAVSVTRGPGRKWGNPYIEGPDGTRAEVVEKFRQAITPEFAEMVRRELRGRDLACWCPLDQPCHADVLLEVADS